MELHQLRYFTAVADLGNFTKAAEKCFVAQPSLSQQIIKLEKELGQPLFERLGRKVLLTDAGRALYQQAVAILSSLEEARQRVTEAADAQHGTVTVGAIPTVAPYVLPKLVRDFARAFPSASVIVHEDLTEHTIKGCLAGELDLGIVALPILDPLLSVEPLFEEELWLALPPKHALARKKRVTIDDLEGEPFILLSEAHCLGQQIVSFCTQQSCRPAVTCRSAQLLTVQELVAAGHGVSLIPDMACRHDRGAKRCYRSLSGRRPMRTLAMIWHKHRYQPPLVRQFIDLLRRQAAERNSQSPMRPARRRRASETGREWAAGSQ
ncbi:MAG: LysR family transcriptional regulator [Planctomycetia bacterium]|nr:LysR family transcriptional regulator [Planctomycetia bacterium]